MAVFLYLLEAIIGYYSIVNRSKDILNPFAISGGLWMLCAGISQLHLSNLSRSWCLETHIAIHIFFYMVIIVGFIFTKSRSRFYYSKSEVKITRAFNMAYSLLIVVVILCCLLEWRANNFDIVLLNKQNSGDLKSGMVALKGIHYFSICLPYCALISFFCVMYDNHHHFMRHVFIIMFAIFYVSFIELSRGTLLIMLLGMLYIYHTKKRLRLVALIIVILFTLCLLSIAIIIRLQNNASIVFTAVEGNIYISSIYTYIETPFLNLDQLIANGSPYSMLYATILRPLCQVLRLDLGFEYIEYNTLFFNARTMIYGFYHDLGFFGIFLFTFIIYSFIGYIYRSVQYSGRWILLLAAFQKALYMPIFGNYFIGTVVTTFPFFIIFLLTLLLKQKHTNNFLVRKECLCNE